jgi:hypothetical protein
MKKEFYLNWGDHTPKNRINSAKEFIALKRKKSANQTYKGEKK